MLESNLTMQHNPALQSVYKLLEERVENHYQQIAAAAAAAAAPPPPPQPPQNPQATPLMRHPGATPLHMLAGPRPGMPPPGQHVPPPPLQVYSLATPAHAVDSSFMTLPTPAPHRSDRPERYWGSQSRKVYVKNILWYVGDRYCCQARNLAFLF